MKLKITPEHIYFSLGKNDTDLDMVDMINIFKDKGIEQIEKIDHNTYYKDINTGIIYCLGWQTLLAFIREKRMYINVK